VQRYFVVRLNEDDKADLFVFAKEHHTTASEIVRQLIRGAVRPDACRLISNRVGEQGNNFVVGQEALP
jgi:hypothetical protein